MAKRYGAKYSPGEPNTPAPGVTGFRGVTAGRVNLAARMLFLLPLPLFFAAIGEIRQGDPVGIIVELGGFCALMLGAHLLNEGLRAEIEYNSRKVARPPAMPRKAIAAVLAGLGVTAAAFAGGLGGGLIGAVVMGGIAVAAHLAAFGTDPMRRKGLEGASEFDTERVALAVEKAEALVREIKTAASRFGDRALEGRVDRLAGAARDLFRTVEEDPRDLSRARKFMSVYLMGARDATVKFADLYARNRDPEARADYEALLGDLETSFSQQRDTLLLDDRSDLDVEIEVLRERLQQEGARAQ